MYRPLVIGVMILLATAAPGVDHSVGEPDLVVHEWGTFTSLNDLDGAQLRWQTFIRSDLPGFIYGRGNWVKPLEGYAFHKRDLRARQRMETPVIYFTTDRPREVHVAVRFRQGLFTECIRSHSGSTGRISRGRA